MIDHIAAMRQAREALNGLLYNIRQNAPQLSGKSVGFAEESIAALDAALAKVQEPVERWRWVDCRPHDGYFEKHPGGHWVKFDDIAAPPAPAATVPVLEPLTEREVELIDGMIEVQLHHAKQCDGIANRTMAEKQKGWDMERVELLRKLKAAHAAKLAKRGGV